MEEIADTQRVPSGTGKFVPAVEEMKKTKSLTITGKPGYIDKMYSHLRKEHPSTRRRMKKR